MTNAYGSQIKQTTDKTLIILMETKFPKFPKWIIIIVDRHGSPAIPFSALFFCWIVVHCFIASFVFVAEYHMFDAEYQKWRWAGFVCVCESVSVYDEINLLQYTSRSNISRVYISTTRQLSAIMMTNWWVCCSHQKFTFSFNWYHLFTLFAFDFILIFDFVWRIECAQHKNWQFLID